MSIANCMTLSAFRSEWTTTLATLRCTNTSPGSRPRISLAGTRLSAQPIHRYCGACCASRLVKKPGVRCSVAAAQRRLLSSSSVRSVLIGVLRAASWMPGPRGGRLSGSPSHRLREQLAADQHPAHFRRPGADLVQLRIAPEAPERVLVDVAVAAEDLDALAGHPSRLLGAPEDHRGAVLPNLAHVLEAELVEVLADRVAERARRLQHRVHVGDLALDQLELADRLAELLAVVDVRDDVVHHRLH